MRRKTIQVMEIAIIFFAVLFMAYGVITGVESISYITIISDTIGFKDMLFKIGESVEIFGVGIILLSAACILHILTHVGR